MMEHIMDVRRCSVCGLDVEVLTPDCPGIPLPPFIEDLVNNGVLTYIQGLWNINPHARDWASPEVSTWMAGKRCCMWVNAHELKEFVEGEEL